MQFKKHNISTPERNQEAKNKGNPFKKRKEKQRWWRGVGGVIEPHSFGHHSWGKQSKASLSGL